MATTTKDTWVANLIEPWRGDSNSMSVTEFFESIDEVAEMGRLTAKNNVHLIWLKLRGTARSSYSLKPELRVDVTSAAFKTAFMTRFKE